jgi:hypothetical protein
MSLRWSRRGDSRPRPAETAASLRITGELSHGAGRLRPYGVTRDRTRVQWALAPSSAQLDPDRCLGQVDALPLFASPGEWCTVVIVDDLGEMRWTFLALEPDRTTSLFLERRGTTGSGGLRLPGDAQGRTPSPASARVAQRERTDGSEAPARRGDGGVNRTGRTYSVLRGR